MLDNYIMNLCDPCYANFTEKLCPEELYVYCSLYPKRMVPLGYLVPATMAMAIIFFVGIVSNVWIIQRLSRKKQDFRTADYYLLCLAISDTALLIFGMPYHVWYIWNRFPDIFGQTTCQLNKLITESTGFASSLNLLAFSIERYRVIRNPLQAPYTTGRTVACIMLIIWCLSLGVAMPFALQYESKKRVHYPPGQKIHYSSLSVDCRLREEAKTWLPNYFLALAIILFLVPLLIQIFVYVRLGLSLRSRLQDATQARMVGLQNRRTYIISAILVTSFCLCWLPFHVQRIITGFNSETSDPTVAMALYVVSGIFYFFSAAINPFMYKSYREKVMSTISSWRRVRSSSSSIAMTLRSSTVSVQTSSPTDDAKSCLLRDN